MARSKSSGAWLTEHFNDNYVKQSRTDGYRSRASYKLLELNAKDQLIKPGMRVVDLGSAPGGWSQVAAELVTARTQVSAQGHKRVQAKTAQAQVTAPGKVIASDILAMDPISGVTFIQGDFTEESVFNEILNALEDSPVDLVISDMAPNMSGNRAQDQPAALYLVELALDMARQILKPDGAFATKVFQGEGFEQLLAEMRRSFKKVVSRKPSSSRARSSEIYLVGKGYRSDQLG